MNGKHLLTILFILFFTVCNAQQFGGFPPSTRWRQIKTDTVRVIYEASADSIAQNVAAIIHRLNQQNPNPLGNKVRPVDVVLHQNTTLANGYVALGPFRSEFFLIPTSDIFEFSATPWHQTLAVHEYRHVHQYSNFNKGVSRVASLIFGQEGQAAFNALSIPDWFFEGDAVHSETITTAQGRGRSPFFFNNFKAIWHEQRKYTWAKLRAGSLKDRVPDHYPLGYMLVNYGYKKHGPDFWRKVTEDALSFKGVLRFFGGNIKRVSGQPFKEFRNEALEFYKHDVSTRRDAISKRELVKDYLFPQAIGTDSLIYLKTTFRNLPAFYIQDRNREHKLKLRNITGEDWFSYKGGTVAYVSYGTSARWLLNNYSNIVLLDVATGSEKAITNKGRYFTPDISTDGSKIVAVAYTDSLLNELHVLSREGQLQQKIKAPVGGLFVHPRFAGNDTFVVAVRNANSTMSLHRGVVGSNRLETLLAQTPATLGYPFIHDGRLYFVSSLTGNDDVYEADLGVLPIKTARQLTFGQTGNYFPAIAGDSLIWSHFTSNGYRLRKAALVEVRKNPTVPGGFSRRTNPFQVAMDSTPNVLANPPREFATAPYKKSTGLFNFHSWRPYFSDPEISYSLYSNNILNTFRNQLFYRYNLNETSHAVGLNTSYAGFFPVLNAGVTYTYDRTIKTTARTYTLNQFEGRVGYNIPLNFTGGKTFKILNFGSNFVNSRLMPSGAFKNILPVRDINYLHHFVGFTQQLPRAVQHIFPKFGYSVSGQYRHLLGDEGFQTFGGVTLFLPSIRNHSIVLAGNLQQTDTANSTFSNRFANSRGYNDFYFTKMWRLSGNYHMPLLYPDWGIPGAIYFMRIRSNVFYDYTRVFDNRDRFANQRSVGGELYFDSKLFNTLPVTFGFRVSHLLDNDFSRTRPKGTNYFEFIIPLDLIPQ